MAKKKRSVSQSTSAAKQSRSRSGSRLKTTEEFNPDYTYVIKDLKRIGSLAVSFFVILVVLAFFLR